MKALYLSLLIFILLIQPSCSKNGNEIKQGRTRDKNQNQEETPGITYRIVSLEFDTASQKVEEDIVEKREGLTYNNSTSLTQKIILNPNNIFERSLFKLSEEKNDIIINDSSLYSVPLNIDGENISLGEKKWAYSRQEVWLPSNLTFKDSIYVKPWKKMVVDFSVIYRKIRAKFILNLENKRDKSVIKLVGEWTGVYPLKTVSSYKEESI